MSKIHELKCWPPYFQDTVDGKKQYENRINDRDFKEGDILRLREWIPENEIYSGRTCFCIVKYVAPMLHPNSDHVGMTIQFLISFNGNRTYR